MPQINPLSGQISKQPYQSATTGVKASSFG